MTPDVHNIIAAASGAVAGALSATAKARRDDQVFRCEAFVAVASCAETLRRCCPEKARGAFAAFAALVDDLTGPELDQINAPCGLTTQPASDAHDDAIATLERLAEAIDDATETLLAAQTAQVTANARLRTAAADLARAVRDVPCCADVAGTVEVIAAALSAQSDNETDCWLPIRAATLALTEAAGAVNGLAGARPLGPFRRGG